MDVIVIGAGIIGTSIAWRLSQQGLRVALLDAGKAGAEASWAGAGMLAPGGEISERTRWTDFAIRSARVYPSFVEELAGETGCPIDYQRQGALEIAVTEAEWIELEERAERQRLLGIPSRLGDRAQTMFYPEDGAVDPRHVTHALLAACGLRGVEIRENLPVTGIHSSPGSAAIETPAGRFSAGVGVLAAGAWSGSIPFFDQGEARRLPGSFPVRGHLIGYDLAPGSCPTILRHGPTYIVQRASGFTICGSSMEEVGFDRRIEQETVRDIAGRAEALLPALRGATPRETWIGFRPRADAHRPHIERFGDSSLWLAYGHFRNGILLAPATAERIVEEIISRPETDSSSPSGNR